jgi:hypothetical protein
MQAMHNGMKYSLSQHKELCAPVWTTLHKEALLDANKAFGLEVNSTTTKCKFMTSLWKVGKITT